MKRRLLVAVPWIVLVLALLAKWRALLRPTLPDFRVYREGAIAVLHGVPLYDITVGTGHWFFTYPPFSALLAFPFAALPNRVSGLVFTAGSVIALVISCWLIAARLPKLAGRSLPWSVWPLTALLFGLGLFLEPITNCFDSGQVGIILMAMLLFDTLYKSRWTGIVTGIAIGIKITPAVFLILMLTTRRWSDALRAAAAFLVTVAIGFVMQPGQARLYWTKYLFDSTRVARPHRSDNHSIFGQLDRYPLGSLVKPTWIVAAIVVFAAGTWLATLWWGRSKLVSACVIVTVSLLVSPVTWVHHWVWIVPIVASLAALAIRAWVVNDRLVSWLMGISAAVIFVIGLLQPRHLVRIDLPAAGVAGPASFFAGAAYLLAGVAVLLVTWVGLRLKFDDEVEGTVAQGQEEIQQGVA